LQLRKGGSQFLVGALNLRFGVLQVCYDGLQLRLRRIQFQARLIQIRRFLFINGKSNGYD
jgi:hypothetical protein